MKIAYVTSMLPYGVMEAFVIPELLELSRRGHELLVVPMHPRGPLVHRDAARLEPLVCARGVLSPAILAGALAEALSRPRRAAAALGTVLRSRSPRVLAKNLLVFPKGLWLGRVARRVGADHIHAQWASSSATIGLVASRVSGIPWSLTAHRWDITEDNLLAEKARSAAFFRVISERGLREAAARAGRWASRLVVIHMGVALPERTVRPRRPAADGLRVVVAANLLEVKGHVYLFDAVRALRERGVPVVLDVAGDGPLRASLVDRVERLGLAGHVRFLGVLPHDDLLAGLHQGRWTAMALPSIVTGAGVQEGIPVSLIEAMACRVPVVSTLTGAIPELLGGGAGLLVRDRSGEELAAALESLWRDAALRERVAAEGERRVRASFSVEATVTALLERIATPAAGRERDGGGPGAEPLAPARGRAESCL